jgi:two-component sensor histidine kinase
MTAHTPTVRRLLTGLALAFGLASVRYFARVLATRGSTVGVPFSTVLAVHLLWLCAAPVILLLAHRALRPGASRRDAVRLAVAVLVTLLAEPSWTYLVVRASGDEVDLRGTILYRADLNALVVALLVGLELTAIRLEAARVQMRHHARLLRALSEAQLTALTLHLQPHFLFNTLQLIAETARTDARRAAEVVCALRRLLAESARHTTRRVVTAADEIAFLEAYVSIQLTRFEERLRVEIDCDPEALGAEVPHMLLQPLVENAIQHGIGRRANGGTIRVSVRTTAGGSRLIVLVSDDGPGLANDIKPSTASGRMRRGVANTRARLSALYGSDFAFEQRQLDPGAEMRIDIPMRPLRSGRTERSETELEPVRPVSRIAWFSRLAIVWALVWLVQPLAALLVARDEIGAESTPPSMFLAMQLREMPFWLLAFLAAELVERFRRADRRMPWLVACHVATAGTVILLHALAAPVMSRLLDGDGMWQMDTMLFGLRVILIYGTTVTLAHAHMLTGWAAARSGSVQKVNAAVEEAERAVERALVHQPALIACLDALEASCASSADEVDARAQAVARLLRLCLDALDNPSHDLDGELAIAEVFCTVFDMAPPRVDIANDECRRALVPPGAIAVALTSVCRQPTSRPVRQPVVAATIASGRLEVVVTESDARVAIGLPFVGSPVIAGGRPPSPPSASPSPSTTVLLSA